MGTSTDFIAWDTPHNYEPWHVGHSCGRHIGSRLQLYLEV